MSTPSKKPNITSPAAGKQTITIEADLLPLLLAAVGPDTIGAQVFKKMVALKPSGRKEMGYYHFFRGYKDKAKQMLAAHSADNADGSATNKEKKVPESRKRKAKAVEEGTDEDADDNADGSVPTKAKKVAKSRKTKTTVIEEASDEEQKSDHEKIKVEKFEDA